MNPNPRTVEYLETQVALFSHLAAGAWTAKWRNFWQGQVDSLREELKSKMVNPLTKPTETGEKNVIS